MSMTFTENDTGQTVGAYAQALSLKLAHEHNGLLMALNGVIKINYPHLTPISCLSDISTNKEFIAEEEQIRESSLFKKNIPSMQELHLVRLITSNPFITEERMNRFGYELVSEKKLMLNNLENINIEEECNNVEISVIFEKNSIVAFQLDQISEQTKNFRFFALLDDKIVSRAQVVVSEEKIAFIYNIFTEKNYRKKGYASKLMAGMTSELKNIGMEKMILIPSPMADKIRLYNKWGFKNEKYVLIFKK